MTLRVHRDSCNVFADLNLGLDDANWTGHRHQKSDAQPGSHTARGREADGRDAAQSLRHASQRLKQATRAQADLSSTLLALTGRSWAYAN